MSKNQLQIVQLQIDQFLFLISLLQSYNVGIDITEIKLQVVDPPEEVKDAFQDVTRALEEETTLVNTAKQYAAKEIPVAKGQVQVKIREAAAFHQRQIEESTGETARFLAIETACGATALASAETESNCGYTGQRERLLLGSDQILTALCQAAPLSLKNQTHPCRQIPPRPDPQKLRHSSTTLVGWPDLDKPETSGFFARIDLPKILHRSLNRPGLNCLQPPLRRPP